MSPTDLRNRIARVMAAIFGIDPGEIPDDASMETIPAWTSLRHMELVIALEQEFGVELDDAEVVEIVSLRLIELALAPKVT